MQETRAGSSPGQRRRWRPQWRARVKRLQRPLVRGLVGAAAALLAQPAAHAQAPPHVNETHASLNWIMGRWRMPVTCVREDGERIQLEEAVVFRPAREDRGGRTVRMTLFGIDVAGAERCYTLIDSNLRDRRGVLDVTFISQGRPDVGISNLRRTLADGEITYDIVRGKLRVRDLAQPDQPAVVYEYHGSSASLVVRSLAPGSDGYKLLDPLARKQPYGGQLLRRLSFEWGGDDMPTLHGYFLEDGERRPGRR